MRFFRFRHSEQRQAFLAVLGDKASQPRLARRLSDCGWIRPRESTVLVPVALHSVPGGTVSRPPLDVATEKLIAQPGINHFPDFF
jgi:hypothetical protein